MSPPAFVAEITPGEAPQGLAGVEGPQAFDGAGHIRPGLVVGRDEPSHGTPVAGDRDLLAGTHRVQQGGEVGLASNAPTDRVTGRMAGLQPVVNQFMSVGFRQRWP